LTGGRVTCAKRNTYVAVIDGRAAASIAGAFSWNVLCADVLSAEILTRRRSPDSEKQDTETQTLDFFHRAAFQWGIERGLLVNMDTLQVKTHCYPASVLACEPNPKRWVAVGGY
jgi:hypothetical protein